LSVGRRRPSVTFQWVGAVATVIAGDGRIAAPNEAKTSMGKAGKLKILYGEGEAEVIAQQAPEFEKAGHTVQQAVGRKAVQEALNKGSFDLVVLGPSLSRNDRHHLPYMVKKASAATKVMVMHADGSRHPYVDACTDTGVSMESVVARIDAMGIAGATPKTAGAAAGR
jgi:hypothetical protein